MRISELQPGVKVVFLDVQLNCGGPWDVHPMDSNAEFLSGREAIVVVVQDPKEKPGKVLGVCFKKRVPGGNGHNLDGLLPDKLRGHGMWLNPEDVYTEEEHANHKKYVAGWLLMVASTHKIVNSYAVDDE